MSLSKRGKRWYGENHSDLREELIRYSKANEYPIDSWTDVKCRCGCFRFKLSTDEDHGVALRECVQCHHKHLMGDSAEYADEAEIGEHECTCRKDVFEISVGIHRYRDQRDELTEDVRWLYIGCRCIACGQVGCYADWKNEFSGFRKLLRRM